MNKIYTPVQRAQRRMNKTVPVNVVAKQRADASKPALPSMSDMIRKQAAAMKRAGRLKHD